MSLYSLKILETQSSSRKLYLSKRQLEHFGLYWDQELTLQIGFTKMIVQVAERAMDHSSSTLYVSTKVLTDIIHYNGEPLWLAFLSKDKIVLGPTVGITVSSYTWKNIDKMYAINKRALLALEKGLLFYCFHLNSVDLENKLVEAYILNPNSLKWDKKVLPLPQIVYHRSNFPIEHDAKLYDYLWQNPAITHINSTLYFDKWNVYQALASSKETSKFQPETKLLSQLSLERFINKYKCCYIKNIYGRCGKQVLRLERGGKYFVCKAGGNRVKTWNFVSSKKVYRFLKEKLGKNLIIQQGISLARLNDRPFDIRVLVQKNFDAEWIITALSFRVAHTNAAVTNCAAGAKEICLAPGDNLLGTNLSMEQLENFTKKTMDALETSYGALGEVGLDIGLDFKGKIWLIEANSQPSSRGYDEAATEQLNNQILGLPLDYAKYLARQSFK